MSEEQEFSPHRADVVITQESNRVTLKTPAGEVILTAEQAQEVACQLLDAAALANDEEPEENENENTRIPMQYIHVAAERLEYEVEGSESAMPSDEEMGDAKWAEVHCWIRGQTARNAMHLVTGSIAEHGWVVTEVIEQIPVMRDDFTETEYLPYYEQALIDSEVFLYEIEDETEELGSSDNVS